MNQSTNFSHLFFRKTFFLLFLILQSSISAFAQNITGKAELKEENKLLFNAMYLNLEKFKGDTLPERVYNEIKQITLNNKSQLEEYIKTHKPSKDFIKKARINLDYFTPEAFYSFEHNNKYTNQKAYYRNIDKWKQKRDEIFSKIKINNDDALSTPNYQNLVTNILLRKKEELWKEASGENKERFYKEWYNTSMEEGNKLFSDDTKNILTEKIIQKYYTEKSAEFAYVILLNGSIKEENNKNLPQIFENFKKQFPNSTYISQLQPKIDIIIEKNNNPLTDKMIFVKNGEQFNTFEEVINQFKGKTVLIDMWGTWCDPCRKQIAEHSEALHENFKDKDMLFLYIANFDIHNPENWKKIIAYQSIKGFHILANDNLTKDIMTKSKGTGYPTYIILKKNGSYELSKAGYPMNRETLINQLDEAINQ